MSKAFLQYRSNVGFIFQSFARMEGEREKSPINAEQQTENIHSVPSDGQETSGQPSSSATSALTSKPESPGKHMDSSERALSGMYFNLELHERLSTTSAQIDMSSLLIYKKHFRFGFQNFGCLARADACSHGKLNFRVPE